VESCLTAADSASEMIIRQSNPFLNLYDTENCARLTRGLNLAAKASNRNIDSHGQGHRPGTPFGTVSIKQVDANTFAYKAKNMTERYRASGRSLISSDGKTMTMGTGMDADGNAMMPTLGYGKR
jgi:hypothetical protein